VQRVVFVDQREEPADEFIPLVVADFAKRDVAAEVFGAVGVAAGAAERAFPGDLDRQRWTVAAQDAVNWRSAASRRDDLYWPR
jgi:hypothetical protein